MIDKENAIVIAKQQISSINCDVDDVVLFGRKWYVELSDDNKKFYVEIDANSGVAISREASYVYF